MISTKDYYTQYADLYNKDDESSFFIFKKEISQFSAMLPAKPLILDAGCGPGKESQFFVEQGHEVIGLDISEGMLDKYKANISSAKTIQSSFTDIPLENDSVDAVFCSFALLHLNKKDGGLALSEFTRVLRKNGLLFLGTTIQDGNDEFYTHKKARNLDLPGIYFYHWQCDELLETFKKLKFELMHKTLASPLKDRPGIIIYIGRKCE